MTKLEDRLRRDLPDLADALIAHHAETASGSVDELSGVERAGASVTALRSPPDREADRGPRWMPLLAAASVGLVLIGVGVAVNAIRSDGDGDDTAPVIAAQLEDDSDDPASTTLEEQLQEEERRAALIADPPLTLDAARTRWEAEGFDDYRYRLRVIKGDRTFALDIEVGGSTARRLEPPPMPPDLDPPTIDEEWIATVDELFGLVAEASPTIVPTFDPELGYPTAFRLDPDDSTVGSALTYRVDELSSIADIQSAERALSAWLPEPSFLPVELAGSTFITPETELYLLQEAGGLSVNLVRQGRDICILTASDQFRSGSLTTCLSVNKLRDEGVTTRHIRASNPDDPLLFVAVLPASYHGQAWQPEVTTDRDYELHRTDQSLLVLFGDDGRPGRVRIDIECDCGDLVYEPRIG